MNPINTFPLSKIVLPNKFEYFLNELVRVNSFDKNFLLTTLVTTVSAAVGKNAIVKVKSDWDIRLSLWACLIGPSGSGKSPALNSITKLLERIQKELFDAANEEEIEQNQIIVKDITMEAISKVLNKNPNGIFLKKHELMSWANSFNKYRSGDDKENWLAMYDNDDLFINRATKSFIQVPTPYVSILGGLQPSLLKEFSERIGIENGLFFRFIFAVSNERKVGRLDGETIPNEIYNEMKELFTRVFTYYREEKETILNFTAEAYTMLKQWYDERQLFKTDPDFNDFETSLNEKNIVHVIKLAGIFQIIEDSCNAEFTNTISLRNLNNAIILGNYYYNQALQLLQQLKPVKSLTKLEELILTTLPFQFETKEAIELAKLNEFSEANVKQRTLPSLLRKNIIERTIKNGTYQFTKTGQNLQSFLLKQSGFN